MNDTDFIIVMKKSGFTEKEITELVFYSQRDSSNLQSDVKELAGKFYRIVFVLSFILIVMVAYLIPGEFNGGKVFLFCAYIVVISIIWYITPVKFSYKSYRMHKKHMHSTRL
jgi:cation transport ATPase